MTPPAAGPPAPRAAGPTRAGSRSTSAPAPRSTGSSSSGTRPTPGPTGSRSPTTGPTGGRSTRPRRARASRRRWTSAAPAGDVRLYATQRSGAYGYSLWEFQVWGTGGAPIPAPPLPAEPTYDRLVFSDEFNGPAGATPDPAKWVPETGSGPNNELEYYTENKNAAQDGNGSLVLEARREPTPGSACPPDPLSGSTTCQYTSARLNTYGKFQFTYGRVEARIKVSGTQGLWPAFWMLGADYFDQGRPWPYTGEIDIMEHVGKEPNTTYSTLHAPAYNGAAYYGAPYSLPGGADFADDFHTFAVDWNSKGMTFRVDGQVTHTVDKEELERTRGPWVFDHDFFLILNNAVGGDWPGPPDATTRFPQKMSVDYIKVWQ